MRILFLILCLANIVVAVVMIRWMPDPMAIHFGHGGLPNNFASPVGYAVLISGLVVFFAVLFLAMPWLLRVLPVSWISLPHCIFWMNEENRPRTTRRVGAFMASIGAATMVLFLLMQWLTFQANRATPVQLNMPIFLCVFTGFLAVFTTLTVRFGLSFRRPKKPGEDHDGHTPQT